MGNVFIRKNFFIRARRNVRLEFINREKEFCVLKYWREAVRREKGLTSGYGLLDLRMIMWLLSIIENEFSSHLNHSVFVLLSQCDYIILVKGKKSNEKLKPLTFLKAFQTHVDEFSRWKRKFNYFRFARLRKNFLRTETLTNRALCSNVAVTGKKRRVVVGKWETQLFS